MEDTILKEAAARFHMRGPRKGEYARHGVVVTSEEARRISNLQMVLEDDVISGGWYGKDKVYAHSNEFASDYGMLWASASSGFADFHISYIHRRDQEDTVACPLLLFARLYARFRASSFAEEFEMLAFYNDYWYDEARRAATPKLVNFDHGGLSVRVFHKAMAVAPLTARMQALEDKWAAEEDAA